MGRQAVQLSNTGDYVEFTLTEDTNSLVLRYAMPDSADGEGLYDTLSVYVNGTELCDLDVTSRYAWVYGSYPFNNDVSKGQAHRFFDETRLLMEEVVPAGSTIRIQKDESDTAAYYVIDLMECELVGAPLEQNENSLSVTDFGAVPNDGEDDRAAFDAAITAATEQGKEVYIPAGRFDLVEEKPINAFGVTIRGAGMWHTELYGPGAAFMYQGTSKFYDFAMTGVSCVRDDSGDLAGFEGNGNPATNITIQNIWMEHMKVGVWASNNQRVVIQGCRIRNTYADGINLCSGTMDSVVRNNHLRNTGDDCIAIWPWLADCSGNLIAHNTVQVPTLANCIAVYGGGENVVEKNHVMDTIANGAGIVVGSEFPIAKGFTGGMTIRDNVLDRCGSMQFNENYPIGAIWIWSAWTDMTTEYLVYGNTMNDCVHEAILLEANAVLTGVNVQHNTINGAVNAVYEWLNGTGSAKVGNMTANGITGEYHVDNAPNFIVEWVDEDIVTEDPFTDVPVDSFYYDSVLWAVKNGITTGATETAFDPNGDCLRAQVVTFLWRAAGAPEPASAVNPFVDVAEDAFYYKAVLWAVEQGITQGVDAEHFDPNGKANRAQVVTFLQRWLKAEAVEAENPFVDVTEGSFYYDAVLWAAENGITSGVDATHFAPDANANRAQVVTFLYRAVNYE